MKKIFVLFLLFILFILPVSAQQKTSVKCIYINGANNNTPSMQKWFFKGINKLHPQIKHYFETSSFLQSKLLKNGELIIDDEPTHFFWGDKSLDDLQQVNLRLVETSMLSPFLAQTIRRVFAHCMHDAIWVQKDHNMLKITKELHKVVKEAADNGQKVMLFGYSAGSFVTYEYLMNKLPAITWEDFTDKLSSNQKMLSEFGEYILNNKIKPTCIDAITSSGLAVYSTSGALIPTTNYEQFKAAYDSLNKITNEVCVPDNTLLGIVNYASPLVLFYSDIQDPTIEINKLNRHIFIHMKNDNIFYLTVNFADDPLGFPVTRNLTEDEIEELHKIEFDDNGRGFFHDKSDVKSPASCLGAHTSYWKFSKKFSKAVVDGYKEGYLNFYPEDDIKQGEKQ